MSFFDDLKIVNGLAIKQTLLGFKRNWFISLVGIIYSILITVFLLVSRFVLRGPFSILAGILTTLVMSSLISNYFVLVQLTVLNREITFNDFKDGFKFYVWKIYGVFFILYLVSYLLDIFGGIFRVNTGLLTVIVNISFFVLFNALPEVIYLKDYIPMDTIKYTLGFMKDNWVQWAIPNLIIFSILYFASRGLTGFITNSILSANFTIGFKTFLRSILVQMFVSIFMIYRGNLFYILSNSTRRNRIYKFGRK